MSTKQKLIISAETLGCIHDALFTFAMCQAPCQRPDIYAAAREFGIHDLEQEINQLEEIGLAAAARAWQETRRHQCTSS